MTRAHQPPGGPAAALGWLRPLRASSLVGLRDAQWRLLASFAGDLAELLASRPDDPDAPQTARSARLLAMKGALAARGYGALDLATPAGTPLQPLVQFICGYHDIDLRDAATIGHGRLLARHGTPAQRAAWLPRLRAGALCGIAMTEPHGGTQLQATTTSLTPLSDGRLRLEGQKCYVSRLLEAEVFVVICRHADHGLSAVLLDPSRPGVARQPLRPAGLRGWTWGTMRLDRVVVDTADLLGPAGGAAALCAEHFASFRPLVAATALGGAAAVVDEVLTRLDQRLELGWIRAPRDSTLATLGRHTATIHAGLLACLAAVGLAGASDPAATTWGLLVKAHSVDAARHTAAEVGLLAGALGFQAGHRIDKTRRDLEGLCYADGIHQELYRAAGRTMLAQAQAAALNGRSQRRQAGHRQQPRRPDGRAAPAAPPLATPRPRPAPAVDGSGSCSLGGPAAPASRGHPPPRSTAGAQQ